MVDKFMLTLRSENHKTGRMPVSTSPHETCPESCPFRSSGCYGNYGPLAVWWKGCSANSGDTRTEYAALLRRVRDEIPAGVVWRHNQAGDLLSDDQGMIDVDAARSLVEANKGKHGYTYTHYPVIPQQDVSAAVASHNREIVEEMNRNGFVVNISCNSMLHADHVLASGIEAPVTCMVHDIGNDVRTLLSPGNNRVVICLNTTLGKTCTECMLCMRTERGGIVAFPVHGTGKKRASQVIDEWSSDDFIFPA